MANAQIKLAKDSHPLGRTALMIILTVSLSGILYGYDLSIISGALLFMKPDLTLTTAEMSLIVAAVLGGGSLATLFGGLLADRIGRKATLLVSAAVFIVGVVVLVFATDFAITLTGRLIQGIGVGLITIVVPLYIVEVIPPNVRGRSVALFQLFITFGILLGYLVDYAFNSTGNWRAMFATALIPGVIFFIASLVMPKSPRWVYRRGRTDEAWKLLLKTHSADEAGTTFREMGATTAGKQQDSGWKLLLAPGYCKAFAIALAIGILNQLTGVNTMLQYSTLILHQSGLHSGATAVLGSVGAGVTEVVFTIVSLSLIDKVGRRPLLITGTLGCVAALSVIGLAHAVSAPSAFQGYATLVGLIGFLAFFCIGPGVVVWLAISEIMPLAIRAKGMAIALFANSLTSAGLAAVFLGLVGGIGYSGTFFLLAFFVFLYFLVAAFPLPETKDRGLEDIEQHFIGKLASPAND